MSFFYKDFGQYPDKTQEQTALHKLHKETEGNLEWALQTIEAAHAGGFLQLRPDMSKLVEPNIYAPEIPVNLLDWMNAEAKRRQQTPADDTEWKEWATQFRQQFPNAPAWVTWSKRSRAWVEPSGNDWATGNELPESVPEAHAHLYRGFETLRQQLDKTEDQYKGETIHDRLSHLHEKHQAEQAERQKREAEERQRWAERMRESMRISQAFNEELERRGYELFDNSPANEAIREELRFEMPESLEDVPAFKYRSQKRKQQA